MMPLALAAVWLGSVFLAALVLVAAAGMAREWARLTGTVSPFLGSPVVVTAVAAVACMALGWDRTAVVVAVLGSVVVWFWAALTRAPAPRWTAAGTLWLTLPSIGVIWIGARVDGRTSLMWLLAVVWASDIGAYFIGRAVGGARLAPVLSPNKTWAGALGGLACAALVGALTARLVAAPSVIVVPVSLVLGATAQLGDLAESLAKRKFGAKDSGGLIPGHGGLLDRLDSLLAAAAADLLLIFLTGASPLDWRF